MNEKQWEAKAEALAASHAKRIDPAGLTTATTLGAPLPSLSQLRRALIEVDQLLRAAPTPIQQRYKGIDEQHLRDVSRDAQALLEAGSLQWLAGDLVEAAASQARALDRHLFQHREVRGKPPSPATDFLCPDMNFHVIPRPLAKPPEPQGIGTTTYRRRGIVWHRLIPAEAEGYTIDLHWYRDLSLSFRKPDAQVLGALFADLSLKPHPGFSRFVAAEAPCSNEDETITAQVERAYAGQVTVALWPELTMPPERRDKLASALRRRALRAAPGQGPTIVAAGSWHEIDGSTVRNRLHLLSGTGRARFHHDKSLPLESKTLGKEELVPSYRISILIAEDALIAFGICRDFCESQIARVYHALDVDLVVVPSYGDLKTIRAHFQQAQILSTDPGTRAFVVQQVVPEEVGTSGPGYILPPEVDASVATPASLIAAPPSQTHPISFKKV